jgi:hypothetical protein
VHMKAVLVIAVLLQLAANSFALLPATDGFRPYLIGGSLVLGVAVLFALLRRENPNTASPNKGVEAAWPAPAPAPANQAETEVISFLSILQEKGRLVDFLMDDVNPYNDAQIGAAARVVHSGCRAVLQEYFRVAPIRTEDEGSTVQVAAGFQPDEYRLIGKITGQPPFTGVLVHRGWKTDAVKLPRFLPTSASRLPAIAPAEIELK